MEDAKDGLVLDCSVTMAWCFEDEASLYADGVQDALKSVRAVVPAIWPLEVANALLVGERRKRLDEARSGRFLAMLSGLPIAIDDGTTGRAFTAITHLARSHQLSSYDAAYLELAIRRGLPMACFDGKLKAAALAAGVTFFNVP
ncbi:type II toxin-antitoxin system VapC family toxin [Isosphaeraceae bacterium EP7]